MLSDVVQPRKDHVTVLGQVPAQRGAPGLKRGEICFPVVTRTSEVIVRCELSGLIVTMPSRLILPCEARIALTEESWQLRPVRCSAWHAPHPVVSATYVGSIYSPRSTLGSKLSELAQTWTPLSHLLNCFKVLLPTHETPRLL